MILHLVLLRFRSDADPALIQQAGDALLAMQSAIPEIRDITWGPNLGPSAEEYSHVLTVTMDDMPAVRRYLKHPAHESTVAEHVAAIREARLAVDVEI